VHPCVQEDDLFYSGPILGWTAAQLNDYLDSHFSLWSPTVGQTISSLIRAPCVMFERENSSCTCVVEVVFESNFVLVLVFAFVCLCVYVCMCECVYVCSCVCVYACAVGSTASSSIVCVVVACDLSSWTVCVCAHAYVLLCTCHLCVSVDVSVCVCACVCVCICACVFWKNSTLMS
jgi:hypothetical protein